MAIKENIFSLEGKIAVVTGCNRGIGRGLAIGLAENGADIIGVSANLSLEDSIVRQGVEAAGKKFYPYQAEFTKREDLYAFVEKVHAKFGAIDILINNAGATRRGPVAEHSDEDWDYVMGVNLDAQFILTREFGKKMIERGQGKVVFIASMLTFQGGVKVPGYAASKGAIGSLIKAFANEWASLGVNVNGLAPGYILTEQTQILKNNKERNPGIIARIPAGDWGTPSDMVGCAVFLSSKAGNYMHGSIINVDGGWMSR